MVRASSFLALIAAIALVQGLAGSATARARRPGPRLSRPSWPHHPAPFFSLRSTRAASRSYACKAKPDDATAFVWTFQAPEAELLNARGEVVGHHFAGPTWQGLDGSAVVGTVLQRAEAPEPGAIPWLLLAAKAHMGSGAFSTITHIQRLDTVGGVAPSEGCDAAHAGAEVRVPYAATYAFSYPAGPATPSAATPAA